MRSFTIDFVRIVNFQEHKLFFQLRPGEISENVSKYLFLANFKMKKNLLEINPFKPVTLTL